MRSDSDSGTKPGETKITLAVAYETSSMDAKSFKQTMEIPTHLDFPGRFAFCVIDGDPSDC